MRHALLCALFLVVTLAAGSCGGVSETTIARDTASLFTVSLDQRVSIGATGASMALVPTDSELTYDLVASNLSGAKALVGAVHYDTSLYHLAGVRSTDAVTVLNEEVSATDTTRDRLLYCVDQPQQRQVGFNMTLVHYDRRAGLSGRVLLARLTFAEGARSVVRGSSKAPTGIGNQFTIEGIVNASDQPVLTWKEALQGDGDNNGEVNIADFTPLALSFGMTTSPNPVGQPASQARDADYDKNGEVNIADTTALGINLGTTLGGYQILAGPTAGALVEVDRVDRTEMFPVPPNTTSGELTWTWTGPALTDTTVFQVRPYDDVGALGLASTNTVTLEPTVQNPVIQSIDEITFTGAETWPQEDGDYVVILTEQAVDDIDGNAEGIAQVLEQLQLIAMVNTDLDPAPVDGTNSVIWRVVEGGGLGLVGNGGTSGDKGLVEFLDRGRLEIEARVAGSFTATESIGFKLYTIDSLTLTDPFDGLGPLSVPNTAPVQLKSIGTFDWNSVIDGDEITRNMTGFVNWSLLPDAGNTGTFSVDTNTGQLIVADADSGDSVRVAVEFPKTDDVTLFDHEKRSSELLTVNIN
jgi:hypothetical protein